MAHAQESLPAIRALLREVPLIDGHNDLPWQFRRLHKGAAEIDLAVDTNSLPSPLLTDIPRLRAGGVGAQFWAVYLPPHPRGPAIIRAMLEQIDLVHQLSARYSKDFAPAFSAEEIEDAHRTGKIASLIGIEGGHILDNSLAVLRQAYRLGARYLTLTHVKNTDWADAAGDEPHHRGLTAFGEQVIREMNRMGMLVDLSHVSDDTMRAALRVTSAPVIFSHSSARAVCNSPRNVPDDILAELRQNGGIVMACFLPGYLNEAARSHFDLAKAEYQRLVQRFGGDNDQVEQGMARWRTEHPQPKASLSDVADHVMHLCKIAGVDHVGIGSDFEGYYGTVEGLEDVSCYPALLAELHRRGFSPEQLKKIAGLNFLRVFRQVERISMELQSHSRP